MKITNAETYFGYFRHNQNGGNFHKDSKRNPEQESSNDSRKGSKKELNDNLILIKSAALPKGRKQSSVESQNEADSNFEKMLLNEFSGSMIQTYTSTENFSAEFKNNQISGSTKKLLEYWA